ncbi:hypothetical protein C8R44DRAFT_724932 [Mycena epipterygia]|nr:hypothetical protein C8R44DRAFT_724932 [Mycena epipterygia]
MTSSTPPKRHELERLVNEDGYQVPLMAYPVLLGLGSVEPVIAAGGTCQSVEAQDKSAEEQFGGMFGFEKEGTTRAWGAAHPPSFSDSVKEFSESDPVLWALQIEASKRSISLARGDFRFSLDWKSNLAGAKLLVVFGLESHIETRAWCLVHFFPFSSGEKKA